jgi:putative permease
MSPAVSRSMLKRANRWKVAGLFGLLLFAFIFVIAIENLMMSLIIAVVISYTLGPMVNFLERHGVARGSSTSAVFLVIGITLALVGIWLFPYLGRSLSTLQSDMPRYISGLGQFIAEAEIHLRSIVGPLSDFDLTSRVQSQLTSWTQSFFEQLPTTVKTFLTVMVLGPFLAFFMVKDGRKVMRTVMELVPNNLFETALSLQHQINFQIGQFVRARLLESFIVGLVTAIGLMMISFPYPIILGAVAGVTNLIPYLGPLLGAVPAFCIALVNGYTSLDIALMGLVYIIAQLIDAGFLIPVLVAKIVDLHPVTVILVIIAGAQVLGILGMIISIPVASTVKVTVTTVYRHLIDTRS